MIDIHDVKYVPSPWFFLRDLHVLRGMFLLFPGE